MSIRKRLSTAVLWCLCVAPPACAQYTDEPRDVDRQYPGAQTESYVPPPRYLIYSPTAATLPKGRFDITGWVFGNGGVLLGTAIGFSNRFQIGVSYGAESLLGESAPIWNPRVSFQLRLQLLSEKYKVPAITVGYDDQGYGRYIDDYDRYTIKSKGIYAVMSKNFYTLSFSTGFHGGVNNSFENDDGESGFDFFLGWDLHYNREISVLLEYTAALNDNAPGSPVGKGRGYLNLGLRWEYSRELVLEGVLTNLLMNKKEVDQIGRELRIVYLQEF